MRLHDGAGGRRRQMLDQRLAAAGSLALAPTAAANTSVCWNSGHRPDIVHARGRREDC